MRGSPPTGSSCQESMEAYGERIPSFAEFERLRAAVEIVQHDIQEVLGPAMVSVVFADDEAAFTEFEATLGVSRSHARPDAWAFIHPREAATGLRATSAGTWSHFLHGVAEALQELIMESERFRGAAFPPCPSHPNTPLWAMIIEDRVVGECIDGADVHIPIGAFGER